MSGLSDSRVMRAVKSGGTTPEMVVRRMVHGMGFRYRLHVEGLPGKPDLVFPRLRKVIFVHGCFWHGHSCARGGRVPKTRRDYWVAKVGRNRVRDAKSVRALRREGWGVMTVWECELRAGGIERARGRVGRFLEGGSRE